MVKELVNLVKQHDKQVILTTHNPAILEGLTRYQGIFIDDRQPSFTPVNARKKWIDSENRSFSLPCYRSCPPKRNDLPPFERLDTKIEIFDLAEELQSRFNHNN